METYNDQNFAKAYAARFYDVNRLRDKWDRELTLEEIQTARKKIIVFKISCGNPTNNMLKCISETFEADGRTCVDKEGDEIDSSYC